MRKLLYSFSVLLCLIVFIFFTSVQYTVPQKSGTINLVGLGNEVKVIYDKYGIPHISAQNDNDGYMALGYVMARDRLFQMDLLRRLVNGSLSEIFGEKLVETDITLRKLQIKRSATKSYEKYKNSQNKKSFALINRFLAGVHAFLEKDVLPVEFLLLDYKPAHFTIDEMIGLSGYMSLTFAAGLNADILTSELNDRLPQEKFDIINIGADVDRHYFEESIKKEEVKKTEILETFNRSLKKLEEYVPLFHGSNSWVLSGRRTASGYPYLANDPHIGVGNPHVFFEAHLKTPNQEIYGHYIPLSPFPILGHTPHSAWGLTMGQVDDLNIYEEKINPQDNTQVMYKNEWIALEKYTERIKVKDSADIVIEVASTPHGPLLDGSKLGIEGRNLSLHWSVHHPENNIIRSLVELPKAKTINEFKQALSYAAAPGLNVTWASKAGDISWWMMGKFPKLAEGVKSNQILKGWDGKHDVERYYSIEENPHASNPESGVIVSANYKPQGEKFSHFEGYWQPGGRFFRIKRLLAGRTKWSLEDLKTIQMDNTVPTIENMRFEMLKYLDFSNLDKVESEAFEIFKNWDGQTNTTSIGSSIYHKLIYFIAYNLFADELGKELFNKFGNTANYWHAFKELIYLPNHSFWDDVRTERVESGKEIINRAFKLAVDDLKNSFGLHTKNWSWGKLHTVEYHHPLGKKKPLHLLYNIGPVPAQGGRYVINNLGHKKHLNDFRVVHAPATRRLIDLANTKMSYGVLPTGNSGNPFSEHFKDQLNLYHSGEYRPQIMDLSILDKIKPLKLVP